MFSFLTFCLNIFLFVYEFVRDTTEFNRTGKKTLNRSHSVCNSNRYIIVSYLKKVYTWLCCICRNNQKEMN